MKVPCSIRRSSILPAHAAVGEGSRFTRHLLLLIPCACGLLLSLSCGRSPDRPACLALAAPPAVPFTAAHGTQALARVASLLALGSRDAGTPSARRAAAWIAGELKRDGLPAQIDTFTVETPSGPLTCHNVIAELPAARATSSNNPSGDWIVLLSHFDTKSGIHTNFLGANDGGSSTGLLLELARFLREHPPASCNILFGFVDGEECRVSFGPNDGLHGSRRLAGRLASEKRSVRAVILLDMIGDRDLCVTLPSNGTPDLTLLALQCARECGAQDSFRLADNGILDDHQPFLDAGFPAVDLIDFVYGSAPGLNDYWHTPEDTLDKLSAASLATVGRVATGMIRHLDASVSGSVSTNARISSRTRR